MKRKKLNRLFYLLMVVIIGVSTTVPSSSLQETGEKTPFTEQTDEVTVSENTPVFNNNITVSDNDAVVEEPVTDTEENDIIIITEAEENSELDYLDSYGIVNGTLPSDRYDEFPVFSQNSDLQLFHADGISPLGIDEYASSYDPRDFDKVSAVRTQVGGTCWLYASLAACESNLIHKGLADSSADLSELQILYFSKKGFTDKLENFVYNSSYASMSMENYMDEGGITKHVAFMLSQWCGPVAEEKAKIPSAKELYNEMGIKDMTLKEYVGTLELEDSMAQEADYHLCGTKSFSGDTDNPTSVIPYVKKLIANYGAVTASYYSTSYYKAIENGGDNSYYFPTKGAGVNHAIDIIGWDDDFSASNFLKTPAGNGAWLCKNSNGESKSYGNGVYGNGYVWISYYDNSLCGFLAFDLEEADKYENIYGYNHGVENNLYYTEGGLTSTVYHAMPIYTATAYEDKAAEQVDAVLVDTYANKEYKITLYANPVVENNKIVSYTGKTDTITLNTDYAGMYKVDFSDDPLYVLNGNTFGIYVETNGWINSATDQRCKAYTNKAADFVEVESLTFAEDTVELTETDAKKITPAAMPANATRTDCYYSSSDESVAVVDADGTVHPVGFGECDITAVSYDGKASDSYHVVVKCTSLSLEDAFVYTGENVQMTPVTVNNVQGISDLVTWEVSDTSLAEISDNGVLTGKKAGEVTVKVALKANADINANCKVAIKQRATAITVDSPVYVFEGVSKQIPVTITPANVSDNKLVYTIQGNGSNFISIDEKGIVTGKKPGVASVKVETTDGSNISQMFSVSVLSSVQNLYATVNNRENFKVNQSVHAVIGFNEYAYKCVNDINISFSNPNAVTMSNITYDLTYEFDLIVSEAGTHTMTVTVNDKNKQSVTVTIEVKSDGSGNNAGNEKPAAPNTITANNLTYKVSGSTLTLTGSSSTSSSISIPSKVTYQGKSYTVTKIAEKAFKGKTKLTKVVIPATVTEIGTSAFEGCTKLTTVTIGKKVTKIGKKAFYNCSSLKKISIPASVTEIGEAAFAGCKKLTTATIGSKVKKIGKKAFYNCSSLKKITLPAAVIEVGTSAFEGCKKLTSATIGTNAKKIGTKAFYNCSALKTVTFKGTKVSSIGSQAFTKMNKNGTIKVPKSKKTAYTKLLKGKYTSGVKIK